MINPTEVKYNTKSLLSIWFDNHPHLKAVTIVLSNKNKERIIPSSVDDCCDIIVSHLLNNDGGYDTVTVKGCDINNKEITLGSINIL